MYTPAQEAALNSIEKLMKMLMHSHDESFTHLCLMYLIMLFMYVMINHSEVHLRVDLLSENEADV